MVVCLTCGYRNEGVTAYCRHCANRLSTPSSNPNAYRPDRAPKIFDSYGGSVKPIHPSPLTLFLEHRFFPAWRRLWPRLFFIAALAGCVWTVKIFTTPEHKMALSGHRFHSITLEGRPKFFVGLEQEVKAYSQRDGQYYLSLFTTRITETGVLRPEPLKDPHQIRVTVDNWISNEQRPDRTWSTTIPKDHPSIAPVGVILTASGQVKERITANASRSGRALSLLYPRWPNKAIVHNDMWEEYDEWFSSVDQWTFRWSAHLRWKMVGFEPCGEAHCARLVNDMTLTPTVVKSPAWATKGIFSPHFFGHGEGHALIDTSTDHFVENVLQFEGDLKIPIVDLRLVPENGQPVLRTDTLPGELVFHLNEKISVTKP